VLEIEAEKKSSQMTPYLTKKSVVFK